MHEKCPCPSGKEYKNCCQPLHLSQQHAQTAEALMRSRYAAFVKKDADYLIATHHPHPPAKADLIASFQEIDWQGLKVISHKDGGPGDHEGEVVFQAQFRRAGMAGIHQERSFFIRHNGRWVYSHGTHQA